MGVETGFLSVVDPPLVAVTVNSLSVAMNVLLMTPALAEELRQEERIANATKLLIFILIVLVGT